MIRVKDDTVRVSHISNGMLLALMVVEQVYSRMGYETVITSGNDGKHALTSLHYNGDALDFRTRNVPEDMRWRLQDEIKERLGIDYDVILESDHLHVEKQPRRREAI